jgi:hypothetical protein
LSRGEELSNGYPRLYRVRHPLLSYLIPLSDMTSLRSACEIDDVLIEVSSSFLLRPPLLILFPLQVIQLKPRSKMKKLVKQSSVVDSSESTMSTEQLQLAVSSGEIPTSPERPSSSDSTLGEQIKVEFKKALAQRRPSTSA